MKWIEEILEKFSFVQWDRFTRHKKYIAVYGWMDREKDNYKDFIVLVFRLKQRDYAVLSTSTLLYHNKVKIIVGDGMVKCERVENNFKVENCVRLKT